MTVKIEVGWFIAKPDKNVIPDLCNKRKVFRFRRIGGFNWVEGYIINRK